jgi:hypothetical protein
MSLHRIRRRGGMMLEVITSLGILGIAVAAMSQFVLVQGRHRQALERRDAAQQEAANAMEHLFALSWNQLTDDQAERLREDLDQVHGAFDLTIQIDAEDDRGRRLVVEVTPRKVDPAARSTVRLVAWRYALDQRPLDGSTPTGEELQ